MIFCRARFLEPARWSTASCTAPTLSFLAMSMNEQVFTMSTSASSGSGVMTMPAC